MASGGEVNVVFFMEEVQKYDCLYNKYSKSYKDKYIKINNWTKIGEKFDMSAADAEKKFKIVRTGYGRYLKKVKAIPSGSGRDAVYTPTSRSNVVIRPKLSCRVDKNPATAAIIWKHRIATIAQNKILCQTRFSATVAIVATGAFIWKPGLTDLYISS